ncbi:hypothetical protein BC835DRAFT_1293857 [Cytidiella melzeri]|nr:hypothetical protein BC835DRAFT_1293857 [Cytidiella melzeri]
MSKSLNEIYACLRPNRHLLEDLTLPAMVQFINCTAAFRRDILLMQSVKHPPQQAPRFLPWSIICFLKDMLGLSEMHVQDCWAALKNVIWQGDVLTGLGVDSLSIFMTFGHHYGLSNYPLALHTFYPPNSTCIATLCKKIGATLTGAKRHSVLLHTLDKGSVPATAVQLRCSYCWTSYHYNYYVSNGCRVFYAGVPAILQVSAHRFVETRLIDMWINSSLISG